MPFLPLDFPNPGIEPMALVSPALAGRVFTTEPLQKPIYTHTHAHTHIYIHTHTYIHIHVNKIHTHI